MSEYDWPPDRMSAAAEIRPHTVMNIRPAVNAEDAVFKMAVDVIGFPDPEARRLSSWSVEFPGGFRSLILAVFHQARDHRR